MTNSVMPITLEVGALRARLVHELATAFDYDRCSLLARAYSRATGMPYDEIWAAAKEDAAANKLYHTKAVE